MSGGPSRTDRAQRIRFWTSIVLLAAIVVIPANDVGILFSLILTPLALIALWVLMGVPLWRKFTDTTEGKGEKIFFGLMAVVLAGVGAVILVAGACMVPLSNMRIGG